jgi:hypothetical protein
MTAPLKRVDRTRCRTIGVLNRLGIRHRLFLLPTSTLFDRPRLEIYGYCPVDGDQLARLLADQHPTVRVSSFGRASTWVSEHDIHFIKRVPDRFS